MIPDFDGNGNLPSGLITANVEEFEKRFINDFDDSITREAIFNGYIKYCKNLVPLDIGIIQWLNGSFTTNKINPNDIDFVTQLDGIKVDKQAVEIEDKLNELFNKEKAKSECMCDVYFYFKYPEEFSDLYEHYKKWKRYWLKQFGHDRNNDAKGIIEFDLPNEGINIMNYNGDTPNE